MTMSIMMTPILQDITTIPTGSCCVTSARMAGTPPVSDLPLWSSLRETGEFSLLNCKIVILSHK